MGVKMKIHLHITRNAETGEYIVFDDKFTIWAININEVQAWKSAQYKVNEYNDALCA
jgi:hypothetical protein